MVETIYGLHQPSMFTTTFPAKPGSSFVFRLGNLSLSNRKHESDQNPERPQPKLFSHGKPWERRLVWPNLIRVA